MPSAASKKPPLPGPPAAPLPEDLRKLQAEILNGLDSDEEEETTGAQTSPAADVAEDPELTQAVVLQAAGEDNLDDVTQLVFRDKQLRSLSTPRSLDFELLGNLEVLSLSHNLLEDIEPLGMLIALVEVNLNFNRITDLSPLFDCELLEKLFASHNKVQSLEGLDNGCPKLRELALFSNALEDHDEVLETLQELPELRELYLGENACCAAPSHRYSLLQELPLLEVFDGQKVTAVDRKFAAAFLEAANKDNSCDGEDVQEPEQPIRPVTAPAAPRPPLLPPASSSSTSVSLAPLPGQKLRSSRANRIDDLLTQSREASPEVVESRIPAFDLQSVNMSEPERALSQLTTHLAALQQCLDTTQMERENLRFQVRLLEQDDVSQQVDQVRADVERLEVENRSSQAVQSEHAQLQARLAEVERQLSATNRKSVPQGSSSAERQDTLEDDDDVAQLRWENQLLEKRLERMKKYSDQVRHGFLSAQVKSQAGVADAKDLQMEDSKVDPELSTLLADNEAKLRRLHGDVAQTASGAPVHSSVHAGLVKHVQCAQVDVLTLSGEGSQDVEWHGTQ